MVKPVERNKARLRRHRRVRHKISGTAQRPRLCVFRSNKNIYAQLIDDVEGVTLASASSLGLASGSNKDAAKVVGEMIAAQALEKGVKEVVFDRGGYLYHGRVKELAEAARSGGLQF